MASLYDRDWFVNLGDLRVSGLRLKFKVEKSLRGDPNTLDLHIYNLAATTRAQLQARGLRVVLVAGYKSDSQVIFAGDTRYVDHVRDGANWDTHITSGDGELALRQSFSSHSFAPGTKWKEVAAKLAGDLKANIGDVVKKLSAGDYQGTVDTFLQGYTAHGPTARELDRVLAAAGLTWSVQDGKLQLIAVGKTTDEGAIVLAPETGMIGSPDHGAPPKDGLPARLKARSLLQGGLRPGRAVEVRASKIRGFYRCEKVVHEGDTHGSEWYSSLELMPM